MSDLKSKSEFDAVTAFDSLEHVPNVDISLINISRALKQNGTFICVVPVYDGLFGLISGLLDYDSTHVNKKSRDYWLKKFSKYLLWTNYQKPKYSAFFIYLIFFVYYIQNML